MASLSASVQGQQSRSLSVAFQAESISIPFTRIAPIHPGVEVGVMITETVKAHSKRRWNVYAGWFQHQQIDQNFYLRGEYQFAYSLWETIGIQVPVGLGYLHSFHSEPVYEQLADGSFEEKTQWGKARAILNTGVGLSYLKLNSIEPFVKYELMVQSPFVSTVPAGPRTFLKIGANLKIN